MKIGCRETINFFCYATLSSYTDNSRHSKGHSMKAKHFLKGKTKTTCPFISKLSGFNIEKTQWLRSVFYAPQNIENPFFSATVYGLSPYYHHLAMLEAAF